MSRHLLSLPDIVFLEIFAYLSYEDVLYSFVDLHDFHLIDLLTEHGAFRQICLSSQLPRCQYEILSAGIWRYESVRSLVCKEMFSDYFLYFIPCQTFPSLTELRLYSLRLFFDGLAEFVIAHSSTLTHLSVQTTQQSYIQTDFQTLFHTIIPHLTRLKLLDTDWKSYAPIQWNRFTNYLQSLVHLSTYMASMADLYTLAVDGCLPRLRSLHVCVAKSVIRTILTEPSSIRRLRMPELERFVLHLKRSGKAGEEEEQVRWITIETLTSHFVMPRLQRFAFLYGLERNDEIQYIFQSPLFNTDDRHILFQFKLVSDRTTSIDSSDTTQICDIHSVHCTKTALQYNNPNQSQFHYTWFTSSWSKWMVFWMENNDVAPCNGIRDLGSSAPNILLHSIDNFFPKANELTLRHPASFSIVNSSMAPRPLNNIRRLIVYHVVPGLELLLNGTMLPHLQFLCGVVVPLFVAFTRRLNPMETLDTVDHLLITDHLEVDERGFSFKQWHIVLDVLPRLKTLLVQFCNTRCPPMGMADLLMNYIKRTIRSPLTLFSCCIDHTSDLEDKEHFISYLGARIEMECSPVQIVSMNQTRLDAWM